MIDPDDHARARHGGADVPEEEPAVALAISEVGIAGKTVWPRLPEGRIPFDATVSVELGARRRGIHMSRIEEAISELGEVFFDGPAEYAARLLAMVLPRQEAKRGRVSLRGKLPTVSETAVSGHVSTDSLAIEVEAVADPDLPGAERVILGVGIHHITACPCTQAYLASVSGGDPEGHGHWPLLTHSQRALTILRLERRGTTPSVAELRQCLESALHVSQDLLKRGDEAELVVKAHASPQFAEDAVRLTALATAHFFGPRLPPECLLEVVSTSYESIHIHDVHCRLATTLGEVLRLPFPNETDTEVETWK